MRIDRLVSPHRAAAALALAGVALIAPAASAQSTSPAVFVANNGNLEGSVTSFIINPDRTLTFVDKLVTGSRPNTQVFDPGTNALAIALSPTGRYIAVGHATSSITFEQLTIIEVGADATLTQVATFLVRDAPFDIGWFTDEFLAIIETGSNPNRVWLYRFNPVGPLLQQFDVENTGGFTTSLIISPCRNFLYTQDSGAGRMLSSFQFNPVPGNLTPVNFVSTAPPFALGIGISGDGTKIYGGGGISDGGNKIPGAFADPNTGMLTLMPGGPFISLGVSPKQVVVTGDNQFAAVAHGTDATTRIMSVDQTTGALTPTGAIFNIGVQGALGALATSADHLVLTDRDTISDGVRGVYSFTINPDGTLTQHGPIYDTQGITPDRLVIWSPATAAPCPGDLDGDGMVGSSDLAIVLGSWGPGGGPADIDDDGMVGSADLSIVLGSWGPCP